ncbi:hypothetical protein, partial [Pseudomonas sp.]|uniref:hypothetical protein n=1 Tax=Pseudomonas sp. TaxID=306 RepID=UPI0028A19D81
QRGLKSTGNTGLLQTFPNELRIRVKQLEPIQEENELLRRSLNEEHRIRLEAEEVIEEERSARLTAQEKLIEAEAALATQPEEIRRDFNNLADALGRASKWFPKDQGLKAEVPTPHLLVIAALLDLITAKQRNRLNQGGVANFIAAKGWHGAGKTQINTIFAAANKAAKDASKEAVAKAQEIQDSNKPLSD